MKLKIVDSRDPALFAKVLGCCIKKDMLNVFTPGRTRLTSTSSISSINTHSSVHTAQRAQCKTGFDTSGNICSHISIVATLYLNPWTVTMTFLCVQCSKSFHLKTRWIHHLEHEHGLAVQRDSAETHLSGVMKLDPNISTRSMSPAESTSPAFQHRVGPEMRFRVAFDLGHGDEVQPVRMTVPSHESFEKFLGRLHHFFIGDSFERFLRQWEYVLVNRQYEKGDPLPLTSPNTYYAMVGELLRPRSRWRHAIVRRSVSVMH